MRALVLVPLILVACGSDPTVDPSGAGGDELTACETLAAQFCDAACACTAGVSIPADLFPGQACAYEGLQPDGSTPENRFHTRELCMQTVSHDFGCDGYQRVSSSCSSAFAAATCVTGPIGDMVRVSKSCNPDCVLGAYVCP